MTRGVWIVLGLVALAAVGFGIYVATQPRSPSSGALGTGDGSSAGGVVSAIGAGLTGLVATIVGAVETQQTRDARAAAAAGDSPPSPREELAAP